MIQFRQYTDVSNNYLTFGINGYTNNIECYNNQTKITQPLKVNTNANINGKLETDKTTLNDAFGTNFKAMIRDFVYPVGAIYTSFVSTSPATLFGGTWTQITDRFLYCANSSGTTGGEATHLLTTEEMPVHNHNVWWRGYWNVGGGQQRQPTSKDYISDDPVQTFKCDNAGGKNGVTQPHNNMPPYITVFCWRRTA